jgi:predicted AAA+ superfamily ATPase
MMQLTRKRKTLQQDGINIEAGLFVDRSVLVEEIFQAVEEGQHVVLSSPPATGKSSLLD